MSTTARRKIGRLKAFGGLCIVCGAAGVLAACGGTASTQPATTKAGRPTPAQSGADVGTAAAQTITGARTSSSHAEATAAARGRQVGGADHSDSSSGAGVKLTSGHTGKIVAARQTSASNDDNPGTGSANTFNPCTLVTLSEARAVTGGTILGRAVAPLGPTCVYKHSGAPQEITLAIEPFRFAQATQQLASRHGVVVNGRKAYCGGAGAQILLVELPGNRTLNVGAPCGVAQRFAAAAISRLRAEGWLVQVPRSRD
jgi:hypothetical protein